MFLDFWPRGMWDLSFLTRYWTHTPCIGRQSLNHWTTREVAASILICAFLFPATAFITLSRVFLLKICWNLSFTDGSVPHSLCLRGKGDVSVIHWQLLTRSLQPALLELCNVKHLFIFSFLSLASAHLRLPCVMHRLIVMPFISSSYLVMLNRIGSRGEPVAYS